MKKLNELFNLTGKVALVTGGAGFLGKPTCETLCELGASVIIASRNLKNCEELQENLEKNYNVKCYSHQLDISDKKSIQDLVDFIQSNFQKLDILVNNAWSGKKNSFESITENDWNYDIEVCLTGVFRTIKAMHPLLKVSKGVIINVSSMYGHVAPDYRLYIGNNYSNPPSYGAAKAGVIQMTKYLASFLSVDGIRVNCISPGPFPHEHQRDPAFIERLSQKNPLGRLGEPEEIKGAIALLATDASSYITGHDLHVDGGWSVW